MRKPRRINYGAWLKNNPNPTKTELLIVVEKGSRAANDKACAALFSRGDLDADDLRAIVGSRCGRSNMRLAGERLMALPEATADDLRLIRERCYWLHGKATTALLRKGALDREDVRQRLPSGNYRKRMPLLAHLMSLPPQ